MSANYPPCGDPVAITSAEVLVEQAAVTLYEREPLRLEHQPRVDDDTSKDTERLSAIEIAALVAAAVGIVAVFVFAAMRLVRALGIQRALPLAAE